MADDKKHRFELNSDPIRGVVLRVDGVVVPELPFALDYTRMTWMVDSIRRRPDGVQVRFLGQVEGLAECRCGWKCYHGPGGSDVAWAALKEHQREEHPEPPK